MTCDFAIEGGAPPSVELDEASSPSLDDALGTPGRVLALRFPAGAQLTHIYIALRQPASRPCKHNGCGEFRVRLVGSDAAVALGPIREAAVRVVDTAPFPSARAGAIAERLSYVQGDGGKLEKKLENVEDIFADGAMNAKAVRMQSAIVPRLTLLFDFFSRLFVIAGLGRKVAKHQAL
eukprot:1111522-Prymnesium_polylepis.1